MDYERRYRNEANKIVYGQLIEDQKQNISWEIQQREMLHERQEEGDGSTDFAAMIQLINAHS